MHSQNNRLEVLCLGNDDFNNSLNEIKEYFSFKLTFSKDLEGINIIKYNTFIIEEDVLKYSSVLKSINEINIPKLIITDSKNNNYFNFNDKIKKPVNIEELNKKVVELNTRNKFLKNSTIKIKKYILDKNEKKLKQNNLFITITEKEIQLLELLYSQKKPLQKKIILEKVWKYSSDADTHTVETHIYRLRKKISEKFNDEKFIINTKDGYLI